jgi:glycosyltransferase involved in cell wall biosynthesis
MNEPLVSVLMTAYNREKYIAEAIESVLASTLKNFELIIVDDCSTDSTVEICRRYAKNDTRIKIFVNESNLGQFLNRNKAAAYAKAEYIKYLDSDDLIFQDALEKMVFTMQKFPLAVWGSEKVENTLSLSSYKNATLPFCLNTALAFETHYKGGGVLFTGPTATIYRRDAFIAVNGFDNNLGINADIDLNLKLAAVGSIVIIDKQLTFWRKHDEQVDVLQKDKLKMMKEKYIINYLNLKIRPLEISSSVKSEIILIQKILYARNLLKFSLKFMNPFLLFSYTGKSTIRFYELFYSLYPIKSLL